MTNHPYIEREFTRSNLQDGQFNTESELKAQTTDINHAIRRGHSVFQTIARNGLFIPADYNHRIYGLVHPSHTEHEDILDASKSALHSEVEGQSGIIREMMVGFANADVQAELYLNEHPRLLEKPEQAMLYRAAFRLGASKNPSQFIFDIDNTMTVEDPNYSYYDHLVPGTEFCDPHMAQHPEGREVFSSVYPRGWGQAQEQFPETFRSVGSQIKLRAHIDELLHELEKGEHPVKVLTAGMDPLAQGILAQLKKRHIISEVRSIQIDNVNSNYKSLSLKDMAAKEMAAQGALTEFVGDGSSDKPAAQKDVPIAVRYALEGGGFQAELEKNGLVYIPFKHHRDIRDARQEIERIMSDELADLLQSAA